jgi:hypothetical protein
MKLNTKCAGSTSVLDHIVAPVSFIEPDPTTSNHELSSKELGLKQYCTAEYLHGLQVDVVTDPNEFEESKVQKPEIIALVKPRVQVIGLENVNDFSSKEEIECNEIQDLESEPTQIGDTHDGETALNPKFSSRPQVWHIKWSKLKLAFASEKP